MEIPSYFEWNRGYYTTEFEVLFSEHRMQVVFECPHCGRIYADLGMREDEDAVLKLLAEVSEMDFKCRVGPTQCDMSGIINHRWVLITNDRGFIRRAVLTSVAARMAPVGMK